MLPPNPPAITQPTAPAPSPAALDRLARLIAAAGPGRYDATRRALGLGQKTPRQMDRQQVARLAAALRRQAGSQQPAPASAGEPAEGQPPATRHEQKILVDLIQQVGPEKYRRIKDRAGLGDVLIFRLTSPQVGYLIQQLTNQLPSNNRQQGGR